MKEEIEKIKQSSQVIIGTPNRVFELFDEKGVLGFFYLVSNSNLIFFLKV
jgi:hypothetical protein